MSSQSRLHHSVLETVLRPRPLYVFGFIGNAAAFPPLLGRFHPLEDIFGLSLGLLLCAYFFVLWRRGYARRNPAVSYCILFLLLTAIGVAGIRSEFGIAQSLESRYAIYSALLLIFAWFSIVEEILQYQNLPLRRNRSFLAAVLGAVLFCLVMDFWGWHNLEQRNRIMVFGMAAYEHSVSTEVQRWASSSVPGSERRFGRTRPASPLDSEAVNETWDLLTTGVLARRILPGCSGFPPSQGKHFASLDTAGPSRVTIHPSVFSLLVSTKSPKIIAAIFSGSAAPR